MIATTIDARGSLSLEDLAAGMIGMELAVHGARRRWSTEADGAANSIRTLAWLFLHLFQSPETLRHVKDEVKALRASSVPVTAAAISGRMPWLASLCASNRAGLTDARSL